MIDRLIDLSLEEDLGQAGDVTTRYSIGVDVGGRGHVYAKEGFVLAGIDIFKRVFETVDKGVIFSDERQDGEEIPSGDNIISVTGSLSSLLAAERTALNFLQHLSGVATLTSKFVKKIEGTSAVITDTRKTTPGWRSLEKKAVLLGGGENHRFGLYDRFLIKDNHIKGGGGIAMAVERCRKAGLNLKIEVETESLEQVQEAIEAGADIIMLDNMSLDLMKGAVALIGGRAKVEASGNITLANVREIAETGVDYISVGAITHSAPAVDISMKIL